MNTKLLLTICFLCILSILTGCGKFSPPVAIDDGTKIMSGDVGRVEDPTSDSQVQEIVNIIEQMLEDVE